MHNTVCVCRGAYADNASTTSEGLSDFDQDTDLRSSLSDHSSHTPYYLELVCNNMFIHINDFSQWTANNSTLFSVSSSVVKEAKT